MACFTGANAMVPLLLTLSLAVVMVAPQQPPQTLQVMAGNEANKTDGLAIAVVPAMAGNLPLPSGAVIPVEAGPEVAAPVAVAATHGPDEEVIVEGSPGPGMVIEEEVVEEVPGEEDKAAAAGGDHPVDLDLEDVNDRAIEDPELRADDPGAVASQPVEQANGTLSHGRRVLTPEERAEKVKGEMTVFVVFMVAVTLIILIIEILGCFVGPASKPRADPIVLPVMQVTRL